MILVGEPEDDALTITGLEMSFSWYGRPVVFRVSKSLGQSGRWAKLARGDRDWRTPFGGQLGRQFLADPCSAILDDHIQCAQWLESEAGKEERRRRRQERQQYLEEARSQERGRPRRRAW